MEQPAQNPAHAPATHALDIADEGATRRLGGIIAVLLAPGDTLCLTGDLGVGKTALARAVIRARLGDLEADVPSPTFTLVQTYGAGDDEIWHVDLYRLAHAGEARELGLDEAIGAAIVIIEWPDRLGMTLPADRLDIALGYGYGADAGARVVQLTAHGARGEELARAVAQNAAQDAAHDAALDPGA